MMEKKSLVNQEIVERIQAIHNGNENERNYLISDYEPFIVKTISKAINGYVDLKHGDEYSIGLIAFNEAIDSYNLSKGSFLSFARLVIRNRIIDYKRKNKRRCTEVSLDTTLDLSDSASNFTDFLAIREEIDTFVLLLNSFHITLKDLVRESPKQMRGRVRSVKMAKYVVEDTSLKENFYRLKRLPMTLLSNVFEIAIKTIKRTKKFTIASALILDSHLTELKNRVLEIDRGDVHE